MPLRAPPRARAVNLHCIAAEAAAGVGQLERAMAQPSCGTQVVVCVLCAVLLSDCPVAAVRKRKHRAKGGAPAAGGGSAAAADEAVSLFNSGNQMFQGGRLPEAAATYRRAVGLQPTLGSAHYNLGATLGAMGLHMEAVGSYEQATAYKVRAYEGSLTLIIC